MKYETFYNRLSPNLQNLLCSIYGFRLASRRYGAEYRTLEDAVFSREFWTEAAIAEFSSARLRSILKHAAETVPYYRHFFSRSRINPDDIRSREDLTAALPVLDKTTVQQRLKEFYSERLKQMPHSIVHTSGTTGGGLVFPMTLRAEREQWAVWWRYRARFGIDRQTWYAHFYGKSVVPQSQKVPPFWRINLPGHQVFFSAYHMADSYLPYYLEELNKRKTPWIQGYPSLLATMAGFILSGGGLTYRPTVVTVGSESLLPQQKMIIEKAFGTSCRQHYGMAEGVANFSECPEGNLHVDEDYACVEFLPIEGNTCRIIGTGYSNYAFPLIRYDTGDVAELFDSSVKCPCGRPGRLLKSIDGRIEDYVVTPDGRRIGRMDHIFKDTVNVRECQIHQDTRARITFRVVRGKHYTKEDELQLLSEARKRLGDGIGIEISYVEAIERTKAGKLRLVVSEIPEAKIENVRKDAE